MYFFYKQAHCAIKVTKKTKKNFFHEICYVFNLTRILLKEIRLSCVTFNNVQLPPKVRDSLRRICVGFVEIQEHERGLLRWGSKSQVSKFVVWAPHKCILTVYIYFIIQFRQHNIKVKVTATCFDLTSHLQAYPRTIKLITICLCTFGIQDGSQCVTASICFTSTLREFCTLKLVKTHKNCK